VATDADLVVHGRQDGHDGRAGWSPCGRQFHGATRSSLIEWLQGRDFNITRRWADVQGPRQGQRRNSVFLGGMTLAVQGAKGFVALAQRAVHQIR
jgi:hypothetical protein